MKRLPLNKMNLLLALVTTFLSFPVNAKTPNAAVPAPASWVQTKLANGLEIVIQPDHRAPVVISAVWYRVGSSNEPNGITGIAHVLEHMMFQGTRRYPGNRFATLVNQDGGALNAWTSEDETVFYEMLPTQYWTLSLKLESDRMRNLNINPKELAREKQVVLEEWRMREENNPQALLQTRLQAAAFLNNPYHSPVIGWKTDVDNLNLANVRQWYNDWYWPNNAIVVIVGDVEPAQAIAQVKKYFGPLSAHPLPEVKPRTEVPSFGIKNIVMNYPAQQPFLSMFYQAPSAVTATVDWEPYALTVLDNILSGGIAAILPNQLIATQGLSTDVGTQYSLWKRYMTLFSILAVPAKQVSLDKLSQAILSEIAAVQRQAPSADQLERAKAQVIASQIYGRDELMNRMENLGRLALLNLPLELYTLFPEKIGSVTAAQVQQVAQRYLVDSALSIGQLHPLAPAGNANNIPVQPAPTQISQLEKSNVIHTQRTT